MKRWVSDKTKFPCDCEPYVEPNSMVKHITVRHIRGGQPRPYADSIYESTIEVRAEGLWASHLTEPTIRQYAKVLVRGFSDDPKWHEAKLESLEEIAHNVWKVRITEPYLD